jgi:hypothetical protein
MQPVFLRSFYASTMAQFGVLGSINTSAPIYLIVATRAAESGLCIVLFYADSCAAQMS